MRVFGFRCGKKSEYAAQPNANSQLSAGFGTTLLILGSYAHTKLLSYTQTYPLPGSCLPHFASWHDAGAATKSTGWDNKDGEGLELVWSSSICDTSPYPTRSPVLSIH